MLETAVIPVGWTGRSFLGSGEGMPAELLPVLDLPAIHHVVEEAVDSGAQQVLVLGARSLRIAQEYFQSGPGTGRGPWDDDRAGRLRRLRDRCEIRFVANPRAADPSGSLLAVRDMLGHSPFAWLRPDVLIDAERPCLGQLAPHSRGATLLAVHPADAPDADTLPLIQTHPADGRRVTDLVAEETGTGPASRLALTGRHILHPDVLDALEEVPEGPGAMISALRLVTQTRPVFCHRFLGTPFALRTARGLMRANLAMAGRSGLGAPPVSPWVVL